MRKLKYVKLFENFQVNEIFGMFGKKEETSPEHSKTEEIQKLKTKILQVFPESIYGKYLDKLPTENIYKLYQIITANNESVLNDSVILDVINGDDSKRELLEKEKLGINWFKILISVIENGHYIDKEGKKYDFEFFKEKAETSYKQVINNIKSKSYLISELVSISRKNKKTISQILNNKL